ncbi:MAG: uracil-DNA glycosylase [Nanoarchaeota archaeon]|nr:uracil-DNA glycosylase [Nanoarchaeota archaeon]MBU1644170.1 uracil-DNA glycosylase [Nanoarchaeota archaeon]MBU1977525.1 uracil-DNA glycosylase [Nanoarchaeota archaeon]
MLFNKLEQKYSACSKCSDLCRSRTRVVFGSGNPDAEVLFIGEAPGANEDRQGVPFCGMSGKILTELLSSAGLSRENIFITNTVLCRPENNRNPSKEEIDNCTDRLNRLINIMEPKVVVTIGNFATERILNKTGIKSIRGKILTTTINNKKIDVVPVVHPASYLYSGRNPEMLEQMKNDFRTIAEVIQSNKKQKNLTDF